MQVASQIVVPLILLSCSSSQAAISAAGSGHSQNPQCRVAYGRVWIERESGVPRAADTLELFTNRFTPQEILPYPPQEHFAGGEDWLLTDEPIQFRGQAYFKFGIFSTQAPEGQDTFRVKAARIGEYRGVPVYARVHEQENSRPFFIYVLLNPGCQFVQYRQAHADRAPLDLVSHLEQPGSSTTLLSVVVRTIVRQEASPVRVDPRPLRANPHMGLFIHREDFISVPEEVVKQRAGVLAWLGIEQFTLFEDDGCGTGPGGMPPAPPEDSAASEAVLRERLAKKALPTCVLVGLPRPGGAHYPPGGVDESERGLQEGHMTTRVVTIGRGDARNVYDVVAAPEPGGNGWKVVKVVRLTWGAS